MTMDAVLVGHLHELRRGTVVVASLTVLRVPGYGYSLLETLSAAGFEVEANTLYPLLRRLEGQGLLTSEWNTDEPRPRKFYRTTEQGDAVARALRTEWARLDRAVNDLDGAPGGGAPMDGITDDKSTQDKPAQDRSVPDKSTQDGGATEDGSSASTEDAAVDAGAAITPGSEK